MTPAGQDVSIPREITRVPAKRVFKSSLSNDVGVRCCGSLHVVVFFGILAA